MYLAKICYREVGKLQKIEVNHEDIFRLLEIISKFDDLYILEVHITKDGE
jgi:hypothetical protein